MTGADAARSADKFLYIPLELIEIVRDERQRAKIVTSSLRESIAKRGVLQAIIVEELPEGAARPYRLIAGERRLTASIELGYAGIPARLLSDLTPSEAQLIELEENIKREDLPWQDLVRAIGKIHRLLGEPPLAATADAIGGSVPWISLMLTVESAIDEERIAASGSAREAYNLLVRRKQREDEDGLEALIGVLAGEPVAQPQPQPMEFVEGELMLPQTRETLTRDELTSGFTTPSARPVALAPALSKTILHESFLHWAPKYSGEKFNLIHCDFPYGVGLFSSNGVRTGDARSQMGRDGSEAYSDRPDDYFGLLDCLLTNLDRLLSVSGHVIFWYSEKHGAETRAEFAKRASSLVLQPFPLIWVKSDNAGIASDVRLGPRHVYETALMATRGRRPVVEVRADAYSAPTDKRWHVSAKPEPMLRHFFGMLVDGSTRLLDPTCGSGSAVRAAESLNARSALGLEIDETTCGNARMALRQARILRGKGASE